MRDIKAIERIDDTTTTLEDRGDFETIKMYYGSADLARLLNAVDKSSWPQDLLAIYNSSLRYDEHNMQILVFGNIALTARNGIAPNAVELINQRYPEILSRFMSWTWNISSNPCADLRLNLSNAAFYPYPSIWYWPEPWGDTWCQFAYSDGYMAITNYAAITPPAGTPGIFPYSRAQSNTENFTHQIYQFAYQASLYANFSDSKLNPCWSQFNNSIGDIQMRLVSNWPSTPSADSDGLSDAAKGGILGGFSVLAFAALYLFVKCVTKCQTKRLEHGSLLADSTNYHVDRTLDDDAIYLN